MSELKLEIEGILSTECIGCGDKIVFDEMSESLCKLFESQLASQISNNTKEIQAKAVMDFVSLQVESFNAGFLSKNWCSLLEQHNCAVAHVKDSYSVVVPNITDEEDIDALRAKEGHLRVNLSSGLFKTPVRFNYENDELIDADGAQLIQVASIKNGEYHSNVGLDCDQFRFIESAINNTNEVHLGNLKLKELLADMHKARLSESNSYINSPLETHVLEALGLEQRN